MSAYLPDRPALLLYAAGLLAVTLLAGFGITRLRAPGAARAAAWALVPAALLAGEVLSRDAPSGFRMLLICGLLLYGMKAVVAVEAAAAGEARLTLPQWVAFAAAWAGMRPGPFRRLGRAPLDGAGDLLRRGLLGIAAGGSLALLARLAYDPAARALGENAGRLAATALLLPALSLFLHFGLLNAAAGVWRSAGVDCRPLFREPLRSRSLGEFWGKRWNVAFTEMTALAVYRPLEGRLGRGGAVIGAFLLSGLLHELAISLPVRAGWGLPLLYFLLHGALVLAEQGLERRGHPVEVWGWKGRAWTLFWLLIPLPILFHPPFLRGVVWPIIGL